MVFDVLFAVKDVLVFAALFGVKEVLVFCWLSFIWSLHQWVLVMCFGGLLCLRVLVLDVFPFLVNGTATLALYAAIFVLVLGLFVL